MAGRESAGVARYRRKSKFLTYPGGAGWESRRPQGFTKQFLEELRGRIDLIIVLALGKTVISRPSDDPRPNDAIRDAQRGGAGRGGAA
jgi:hypothetical protein